MSKEQLKSMEVKIAPFSCDMRNDLISCNFLAKEIYVLFFFNDIGRIDIIASRKSL